MRYYTFRPSNKLADFVRFFWVLESEELTNPYIYRSVADGCAELIFHYKGTFEELSENGNIAQFYSGIHSQSQVYRRFITEGPFGIFGAYLYPFAIRQLFNLSVDELTNRMPDLPSVLGRDGKELEGKMMLASGNNRRCRILTEFLENKLCNTPADQHRVVSAVKYAIHSKKQHTVHELAHHFNLSERQFERKFREYSGFNPKLYMRIIRFGKACNYYGDMDHKSLTDIAYECGYYDQSHFIREFKAFSGYHPGDFFSGKAEGTEWREM